MKKKELREMLDARGKRIKARSRDQVRYEIETTGKIELLERQISGDDREKCVWAEKVETGTAVYYDVTIKGAWACGWDATKKQ